MSYIDYHRVREVDFELSGIPYAVYTHNWRSLGVLGWMELMAMRSAGQDVAGSKP